VDVDVDGQRCEGVAGSPFLTEERERRRNLRLRDVCAEIGRGERGLPVAGCDVDDEISCGSARGVGLACRSIRRRVVGGSRHFVGLVALADALPELSLCASERTGHLGEALCAEEDRYRDHRDDESVCAEDLRDHHLECSPVPPYRGAPKHGEDVTAVSVGPWEGLASIR
jgi:hypothetical protein